MSAAAPGTAPAFDAFLAGGGYVQDEAGAWREAPAEGQPVPRAAGPAGAGLVERCRRYVARMPASVSGQGGHDAAWLAAQAITRGFGLPISDGLPILQEFNQRCQPPWSDKELWHKIEDAADNSRLPQNYVLARDAAARPQAAPTGAWHGPRPRGRDDYSDATEPVPDADAPTEPMPFPLHCLPQTLQDLCTEIHLAVNKNCPPDFPAIALLTVAGAAIGNARALQVKRKWYESGRFYAALIAKPGSAKTAAVEMITEPITNLQKQLRQQWERDRDSWEERKANYERALHEKTKAENMPPSPGNPPLESHLYSTDATTEVLHPILQRSPKGVCIIKDELRAWITSMNQYKGGKGSDRQFWLSAWSGSPCKVDRKGNLDAGSVIVPRPFLNILGGIQPDYLEEFMDERNREDGFLHRVLFSYPHCLEGTPWSEAEPSEALTGAWSAVVGWLHRLAMREDGDDLRPATVHFTAQAKARWVEWFNEHRAELRGEDFPDHLRGPWAKFECYAARLALVLQYLRAAVTQATAEVCDFDTAGPVAEADWPGLVVDVDEWSVVCAGAVVEYFKSHTRRVYERLKSSPADDRARRVVEWIRRKKGGRCTVRDLQMARHAKLASEARKLIRDLVDRGLGKPVYKGEDVAGVELHAAAPVEDFVE